jgi:hypothetical protein
MASGESSPAQRTSPRPAGKSDHFEHVAGVARVTQAVRDLRHRAGIRGASSGYESLTITDFDFDFAAQPGVDETLIRDLASLSYQRSDVCTVPAAGVVAEAMVALADAALAKFGGDALSETIRNARAYLGTPPASADRFAR